MTFFDELLLNKMRIVGRLYLWGLWDWGDDTTIFYYYPQTS
jgi:hypothetical protein